MKSEVFKTWTLVLQLGITILVPILLLVALGVFIKEKTGVDIVIVLLVLGVIVGVRNTYVILKNFLDMMNRNQGKESELLKKHERSMKSSG